MLNQREKKCVDVIGQEEAQRSLTIKQFLWTSIHAYLKCQACCVTDEVHSSKKVSQALNVQTEKRPTNLGLLYQVREMSSMHKTA